MGKEFQKSAPSALFHFVRVRAAFQPHVLEPLGDVGATHKLKCVHKKSRLSRNLLINKDSKFFVVLHL